MAKPNLKKRNIQYIDGKLLFNYYWSVMGTARSIQGVVRYCEANGILNPVLGKPPSGMAVFKAMWRWAALKENFEEGYQIVQQAQRDEGNYMTREEWKEFLFEKVRSAYQYNDRYFKRFLKRNGYQIQPSNPS